MESHLVIRKLFGNHDDGNSTDKHVCPAPDADVQIVPIFGNMTFHTFAMILAGACGLASSLLILVAILRHCSSYTNPVQQRQIIRVIFLVPWISFFSFLIVWLEGAGPYLVESLDFGSALALSAFLLLLCDYVMSHPDGFDDLFGEGALKRGQFATNSPQWLKRTWYSVLQFIPTSVIIWLATVISLAVGTYCATSNKPYFAHIWITVLKGFVTTIAVLAVLRFEKRMISKLRPHNVYLKFFAFKGIIGLNVLQTLIINLLSSSGAIKPTKHMTYEDLVTALPSLILACEMPIFAILLFWSFPVSPYQNGQKKGNPVKAIIDALNYSDIISAFIRGPMRLVRGQQMSIARADSMPLVNQQQYQQHQHQQPIEYQPPAYGVTYDAGQRV